MTAKRVFISFDYDHDEELKNALVGQSKYPNSPFNIADWSVKEHLSGDWKQKARIRIRRTDLVIFICGEYTHTATGVGEEMRIAREEGKPYFLLRGRRETNCTKPKNALVDDKVYTWNWENLKELIEGKSPVENALEVVAWAGLAALGVAILSRLMKGQGNRQERFRPGGFMTQHRELTASEWTEQWP